MDYASIYIGRCYINEAPEMDIIIKLFLLVYLLAMVLLTILNVIWILTAVYIPEWSTKKSLVNNGYKRRG